MEAGRTFVPFPVVTAVALFTLTSITGCGQKGPLTLAAPQSEIIDTASDEQEQGEDQETSGDDSEE